jgi:menaquinone-dependent protoporphyrinogen oxidase
MDDTSHVLVAYATAHGSTAGIAERIAARLRDAGCDVDARPVGPGLDPAAYDAIVVGSAVHDMAWLPPAVEFLARIPGSTPVRFFSVGGLAPAGPVRRRLVALEIARVEQGFPAALRGRDHQLFAGVVRMGGLALWGRVVWRLLGGRDGDHRDWAAIDAWAEDAPAGRSTRADRPPEGGTSATPPDERTPGCSSAPTR